MGYLSLYMCVFFEYGQMNVGEKIGCTEMRYFKSIGLFRIQLTQALMLSQGVLPLQKSLPLPKLQNYVSN